MWGKHSLGVFLGAAALWDPNGRFNCLRLSPPWKEGELSLSKPYSVPRTVLASPHRWFFEFSPPLWGRDYYFLCTSEETKLADRFFTGHTTSGWQRIQPMLSSTLDSEMAGVCNATLNWKGSYIAAATCLQGVSIREVAAMSTEDIRVQPGVGCAFGQPLCGNPGERIPRFRWVFILHWHHLWDLHLCWAWDSASLRHCPVLRPAFQVGWTEDLFKRGAAESMLRVNGYAKWKEPDTKVSHLMIPFI